MRKIHVRSDERPSKVSVHATTPSHVSWTTSSAAERVRTNVRATRRSAPSCRSTSVRERGFVSGAQTFEKRVIVVHRIAEPTARAAHGRRIVRRPGCRYRVAAGPGPRRDDLVDAVGDHGVDERGRSRRGWPLEVGVRLAGLELLERPVEEAERHDLVLVGEPAQHVEADPAGGRVASHVA